MSWAINMLSHHIFLVVSNQRFVAEQWLLSYNLFAWRLSDWVVGLGANWSKNKIYEAQQSTDTDTNIYFDQNCFYIF